ncbi:hypothetical protein [Frigidibacter sp. MR17.24]|uniref:hypothetical protein n=1 Tax=Frigidibacter sp. MR17.24 TaxID=3127345 RepID=UPI0030131283
MTTKAVSTLSPTRVPHRIPRALVPAAAAAVAVLALMPGAAHAYVGPGAGLTAIGTILALIGAVFFALVGFVWYPVKRLLRRGRAAPGPVAPGPVAPGPVARPPHDQPAASAPRGH